MTGLIPPMCESCASEGRETPSEVRVFIVDKPYRLCSLCAVQIMQDIDSAMTAWSLRTGQTLNFAAKEQTWADLGLDVGNAKEGKTLSPCPACGKPGNPVIVDLDIGKAECRVCSETWTLLKS